MTAQGAVVLCGLSQEANIRVFSLLLVICPSAHPSGELQQALRDPESWFRKSFFFFFCPLSLVFSRMVALKVLGFCSNQCRQGRFEQRA